MGKLSKLIEYLLSRPPEARFEEISYVLEAFGYQEVRSRGSHHSFENEQGEVIIIPKKGGKKLNQLILKKRLDY